MKLPGGVGNLDRVGFLTVLIRGQIVWNLPGSLNVREGFLIVPFAAPALGPIEGERLPSCSPRSGSRLPRPRNCVLSSSEWLDRTGPQVVRMGAGRVQPPGSGRSAISARPRQYHSSSSSGAACARTCPAVSSMAGPTMKYRIGRVDRCARLPGRPSRSRDHFELEVRLASSGV